MHFNSIERVRYELKWTSLIYMNEIESFNLQFNWIKVEISCLGNLNAFQFNWKGS